MKDRSRIWTIVAVIVAIFLVGYWIFFTNRIENIAGQQENEVIMDLSSPESPDSTAAE